MKRFLTGLAVGYVFGARAGRERYEQLAEGWREFTDSDMIQQLRGTLTKSPTGRAAGHAEAGMVTPPVLVGPDPTTGTQAEADVVLPDLEASNAASINGETPVVSSEPPPPAKRPDPPPPG